MDCKRIFSIVLLGFLLASAGRSGGEDEPGSGPGIPWYPGVMLTWDDFLGNPDHTSSFKALTSAEILFSSSTYSDSAELVITCRFLKESSWTKLRTSQVLLRHEQLHFDIAEVIARRLRRACSIQRPRSYREAEQVFELLYREYTGYEWQQLNSSYDMETKHGIIPAKQQEWEQRIAKDLLSLDDYAAPEVTVRY